VIAALLFAFPRPAYAAAPFEVRSAAVWLGIQLGAPLALADMDSYRYWLMRVTPTSPACATVAPGGPWRGYVVKLVYQGATYWVFSGVQPANILFLCAPPIQFPRPPVKSAADPPSAAWPGDNRLLPSMADTLAVYCGNGWLDVYRYDGELVGHVALTVAARLPVGASLALRWDAALVRNDVDTLTVYQSGGSKSFPLSVCFAQ